MSPFPVEPELACSGRVIHVDNVGYVVYNGHRGVAPGDADARVTGVIGGVLGEDFNYTGSDGNYYAGDTQWHSDGFSRGGSQRFVKIAFYLDDLTRDTGCLRVIPGSHRAGEPFADTVQEHIRKIPDTWGVEGAGLPAVALETRRKCPGCVFAHEISNNFWSGRYSSLYHQLHLAAPARAAAHSVGLH